MTSIWEDEESQSQGATPATKGSIWESVPTTQQAPVETGPGYAEDIAKGAVGGLGRGITGTLGIGGTIGNLTRWGAGKLGIPEEYSDKIATAIRAQRFANPVAALVTGPSGADIQKQVEGVTGKFYEPKTIPGQYASTIAEFAPSALVPGGAAARAVNVLAPAIASETAGQITKDTAAEPYARIMGGVLGGVAGAKVITPSPPATPARQAAVATLTEAGVPVTAGQRTGSKPIQWFESNAADMPLTGGQQLFARQRGAYDRAVTDEVYRRPELTARGVPENVSLPDPRVATAGPQSLRDEYRRLSQNDFVSNPALHNRMMRAQTEYERRVQPHKQNTNVEDTRNDIVDRLLAGQGRMPGDEYQAIRSQISKDIGTVTNPREVTALRELRSALDDAMHAGIPPADARAWVENNRRYAQMKQIESAVAGASENLSPARVAQSVRAGRGEQYAGQQSRLDQLAKAGHLVLKELPQSGTGPRLAAQTAFDIPKTVGSLAVGGGVGAGLLGPLGALAGAAAPFAIGRAVTSPLGQRYLGNQVAPQNLRDVIAQAVAQQAISQPSGFARNEAAREAYEKKRKGDGKGDRLRITVTPR